jgi:hypothetical protein
LKLSDSGAIPIRVVRQSILSCQHTTILHELALPETIETTPVYSVAGPLGGGTTYGYASVAGAAPCHFSGLGILYARSRRPQEAGAALSAAVDLCRTKEILRWLPAAAAVLAQVLD